MVMRTFLGPEARGLVVADTDIGGWRSMPGPSCASDLVLGEVELAGHEFLDLVERVLEGFADVSRLRADDASFDFGAAFSPDTNLLTPRSTAASYSDSSSSWDDPSSSDPSSWSLVRSDDATFGFGAAFSHELIS